MALPELPFEPPAPPEGRGGSGSPWDVSSHEAWFRRYVELELAVCPHDREPEEIKLVHTAQVPDNARRVCRGEGLASGRLIRACLLAALYHDLGRFAQYRIWATFLDRASCNHGHLSARLAASLGLLRGEPEIAELVEDAAGLHNAARLPEGLPEDLALVVSLVRDADRMDILRVMDEHLSGPGPRSSTVVLSLPDDPALFSRTVVEAALSGSAASYSDLRSVNDARLLFASWTNILSFSSSRALVAREGHARRLVEVLPDQPYGPARDHLLARLDELARLPSEAAGEGM